MVKNYPVFVYRVDVDYLSKEYENNMLSTSSPFPDLEKAETAYNNACGQSCIDDKTRPARVALTVTTFLAPGEYGTTKTLKQNY